MPIKIEAHPTATGIFSIGNPNSSTSRAITLPDASTELVGTNTVQTLTNKTINGGTFNSSTINGGTLALGTAVTASGTAVDFTGIPSWVKRVTVSYVSVSTNGASGTRVQIGSSASVVTTGYVAGQTNFNVSGLGSTATANGFDITNGAAAAGEISGTLILNNVTGNTWAGMGIFVIPNQVRTTFCAGSIILPSTLDRIRITTVNGVDTFDAGTVNIMYEG